VVFRADAAFAKPDVYEGLEERGVKYAIRIPANDSLERDIAELLPRPVGRRIHRIVDLALCLSRVIGRVRMTDHGRNYGDRMDGWWEQFHRRIERRALVGRAERSWEGKKKEPPTAQPVGCLLTEPMPLQMVVAGREPSDAVAVWGHGRAGSRCYRYGRDSDLVAKSVGRNVSIAIGNKEKCRKSGLQMAQFGLRWFGISYRRGGSGQIVFH
jgi:hypothetical protein